MHRGYVKLWRKSIDSAVFADPNLWRTWTCCLMLANHRPQWVKVDGLAEPVKVEAGQFITGRFEFHRFIYPKRRKSNPDPKTVWRWLQALQIMQNLTIRSTNKFSIITIINWHDYQDRDEENAQQDGQLMGSRRPADAQQAPTNKNVQECTTTTYSAWSETTLKSILEEKRNRWSKAYPWADPDTELQPALDWLENHPRKQPKTETGLSRFFSSWLKNVRKYGDHKPTSDQNGFDYDKALLDEWDKESDG